MRTEAEAVAQGQLQILARVLEMVRDYFLRIDQSLPPSPQELTGADLTEVEPDVTSEVRRIVQCIVTDHLDPAIADALAVSTYKPGDSSD